MKEVPCTTETLSKIMEVGPVKIDNPLVEGLCGAAMLIGGLYTIYKVLNDKSAADNIATVRGFKPDKK